MEGSSLTSNLGTQVVPRCVASVWRIFLPNNATATDANPIKRVNFFPPSLHRPIAGVGILTYCPSGAAFAIPLGPTNPWLIDITKETLIFRRDAFSASLRLLVPTFLLPHAPEALTGPPSQQSGTLSYHLFFPKEKQILTFGTMLSPNYFRRKISR